MHLVLTLLSFLFISLPSSQLFSARFDTENLLHRKTFTQRSFYTEKLLHREAFAHRSFYTQKLLHTETFAQSTRIHTEKLSQTASFYTDKLSHRESATQDVPKWIKICCQSTIRNLHAATTIRFTIFSCKRPKYYAHSCSGEEP